MLLFLSLRIGLNLFILVVFNALFIVLSKLFFIYVHLLSVVVKGILESKLLLILLTMFISNFKLFSLKGVLKIFFELLLLFILKSFIILLIKSSLLLLLKLLMYLFCMFK